MLNKTIPAPYWNWKAIERNSALVVPLLFGLMSIIRGQDRNIDLLNYHYYNGYAFLNDRLTIDFAVAGFPTYFNPLLDVAYYLAIQVLPSWGVGFLLGVLHGATFSLLLQILKGVPSLTHESLPRYNRLFLALTGVLCTSFLVGLGTSMGDTTTTPFVLGAILLILKSDVISDTSKKKSLKPLMLAGLIIGFGVGLKLTNAPYALALFFSFLVLKDPLLNKLTWSLVFGTGTALGILISDGFWLYKMWAMFGNPLFPQFSRLFPNELTVPIFGFESRFRPANAIEILLWPLYFLSAPSRVSELHGQNFGSVIVAYLTFLITLVVTIYRRVTPYNQSTAIRSIGQTERYLLVFILLGYVLWMMIFSVYRYFVPIEIFAPFATFCLLLIWLQPLGAYRATVGLVTVATVWLLLSGVKTYGHSRWIDPPFRAEIPPVSTTQKTVVIVAYGDPPWGWLAPLFPPQVIFTQLDGLFPAAPGYFEKIRSMVRTSGQESYAVLPAAYNWREQSVERANRILEEWQLLSGDYSCAVIKKLVDTLRPRAQYVKNPDVLEEKKCFLVPRQEDLEDLTEKNRLFLERAQKSFTNHGFWLDQKSCRSYRAFIGDNWHPYQWCKVSSN